MAAETRERVVSANEIIVVRHGERIDAVDSEWTRRTRLPNHYVPLTEKGKEMARYTGYALRKRMHRGIIHVYSSHFLRCLQTAQEICIGTQFS